MNWSSFFFTNYLTTSENVLQFKRERERIIIEEKGFDLNKTIPGICHEVNIFNHESISLSSSRLFEHDSIKTTEINDEFENHKDDIKGTAKLINKS